MNEQERADLLARALEQLVAGGQAASDDELIAVSNQLLQVPFEPSAAARANFDAQVDQWFGPSAPPAPRIHPLTIVIIVVLAALIGGLFIIPAALTPTPTATPTLTATNTATWVPTNTSTPTAVLPSPTLTLLSTAIQTMTLPPTVVPTTVTPIPFTRIIISGPIASIAGDTISVAGASITVSDGVIGLCVGDWVRVEAVVVPSGGYAAQRNAVTVSTSACQLSPPAQSGGDKSEDKDKRTDKGKKDKNQDDQGEDEQD